MPFLAMPFSAMPFSAMPFERDAFQLCKGDKIVRFQDGSNKVASELRVVQFWSEIILVIFKSQDFEIMCLISDQTALHSVQLSLFIES